MRKIFLTSEWKHLCLLTYTVPDHVIMSRLPRGFEIDRYEGQACVSFVAFDFLNTRVLGVPWPGFRNFSEINLRFYVKANGKRGVMFVKELVPSPIVAWIARVTYNEPYEALPMKSSTDHSATHVHVSHTVTRQSFDHSLKFACRNVPFLPDQSGVEHFFKEHQWGFGRDRRGRVLQYEVRHPHWHIFPVDHWDCHIDYGQLYGPEWAFMNDAAPISSLCALGSPIEVYRPVVIG